jgi:hypothetical protein
VHFSPDGDFIDSGKLLPAKTPIFPVAIVVHAALNPPAVAEKLKKKINRHRIRQTFFIIDDTHAQFIITKHAKRSKRYY